MSQLALQITDNLHCKNMNLKCWNSTEEQNTAIVCAWSYISINYNCLLYKNIIIAYTECFLHISPFLWDVQITANL